MTIPAIKIGQPVRVDKAYPDVGIKVGDEGIIREIKKQGKKEIANVDFDIKFAIILTKHLTPIEKRTKIKEVPMSMIIDEAQMDEFNKAHGVIDEEAEADSSTFKEPSWMKEKNNESIVAVNNPPHYTSGGIETIDFLKAKLSSEQFDGFLLGNVIKYMSRLGKKDNALQDAKKAQWYLNKYLEGK